MNNLKILRKKQKWTQREVANKLGIHCTTYTKYETGNSEPSFEILLKLSELFNVSTDYLLGNTKKPTPVSEDGLSGEQVELVKLFASAPPALRAAALAVLRSAEEQGKAPDEVSEAE